VACRLCRHTLHGTAAHRVCHHGFDCSTCTDHRRLRCLPKPAMVEAVPLDAHTLEAGPPATGMDDKVYGLQLPRDRFYDRGHTWIQVLPNGYLRLGMDALAQKLLGKADQLELPRPGTSLRRHGTAWRVWKHGSDLRLRAPVGGTVRTVASPEQDWVLEIEPQSGGADLTHLLHGDEVRPWMEHEVERVVGRLGGDRLGTCLTDGGELMAETERLDAQHDPRPLWDDLFLQA
jgi:glycine cleavage system H lipoate-binding protein